MTLTNQWFLREPSDEPCGRLVCLPYAGGGASIYRNWPSTIGSLEVTPVQPPWRENRLGVQEPSTFPTWAAALADELAAFSGQPLYIFGHCMGAVSAHALAAELYSRGEPASALIVSSSRVPHLAPEQRYLAPKAGAVGVYHMSMNDEELTEEFNRVMAWQQIDVPEELLGIAVGVLKRDLAMCFSYSPPTVTPVGCTVHAIGWTDDADVSMAEMQGWAEYSNSFSSAELPGDKMSFLNAGNDLTQVIADVAAKCCGRPGKTTTEELLHGSGL